LSGIQQVGNASVDQNVEITQTLGAFSQIINEPEDEDSIHYLTGTELERYSVMVSKFREHKIVQDSRDGGAERVEAVCSDRYDNLKYYKKDRTPR
jgi:hypothetical protein